MKKADLSVERADPGSLYAEVLAAEERNRDYKNFLDFNRNNTKRIARKYFQAGSTLGAEENRKWPNLQEGKAELLKTKATEAEMLISEAFISG